MNEKLLQFIWQFQHFAAGELKTSTGEPIQVFQQGKLNHNQGPDFTDARIRVGNTTWAGQVELHVKSSEWDKHAHQHDPNYANVILHVVWEDDGWQYPVPLLELKGRVSGLLLGRYEKLMQAAAFIPCEKNIRTVHELISKSWNDRMLAERLERKAGKMLQLFNESGNHWDETAWWLLARNFGNPVNADAFEAMAKSLPLKLLSRHNSSIIQLEALLMGQAGLLTQQLKDDDYYLMLQREYRFLQSKYSLRRILMPVHFLRMRPVNFPTVRLAQLAAFIAQSVSYFDRMLECADAAKASEIFSVTANDYWHYHYRFGKTAAFQPKHLGVSMFQQILINTICPLLFAWGMYNKDEAVKEKAVRWMQHGQAEQNRITRGFQQLGIPNTTAADSQALIELKNEYCNARRCLECAIGNHLLSH